MPRTYVALGTDGFGRSDTRANLRAFFGVDRDHIARGGDRRFARRGARKTMTAAFRPRTAWRP